MAGMPQSVVLRAGEIMHHLEQEKVSHPEEAEKMQTVPKAHIQLSMFEPSDPALERIREQLNKLDVNVMTPVEALLKLNELKMLTAQAEK